MQFRRLLATSSTVVLVPGTVVPGTVVESRN